MQLQESTAAFAALTYPITTREIIATIGDRDLALANGSETLSEVLARSDTDTFESPEEVHLTLFNSLDDTAIGRKRYSDRDPPTREEIEPVSF